jgi:hypothetical protein
MENILAHVEEIFPSAKLLVNGAEKNDERPSQTRIALLSEITAQAKD